MTGFEVTACGYNKVVLLCYTAGVDPVYTHRSVRCAITGPRIQIQWTFAAQVEGPAYVSVSGAVEAGAVHASRRHYLPALGLEAVADEPRAGYLAAVDGTGAGYSAGHIDVRRQDVRSIAVAVAADVQVVAFKSCILGNNLAIINYL